GPAFIYAIPLAVAGYLVSQALLKPHILIPPYERYIPVDPYTIAISLLTGVAAAALSLVFMLTLEATGRVLGGAGWAGPVTAGAMLASLTYLLPEAGGFGYEAVNKVLENPLAITGSTAILLITAKIIATAVTVKGGGSGGLFLPTVFIGIVSGALFTQLLNHYGLPVEPGLVIAAMTSSMLAACNKTLVTGVILSLEVFGFVNVIPALLSSLTAYALTINWSIHENQLADRAESMAAENQLKNTG
ncbi:MAG: chloride channel protein, partial [Thermosphaera sp.]